MNYLAVYWAMVFGAKYKTRKQKQQKGRKKEKERKKNVCLKFNDRAQAFHISFDVSFY